MKLGHIVILLSDLGANLPFYETLLPMIGFSKDRAIFFKDADGMRIEVASYRG